VNPAQTILIVLVRFYRWLISPAKVLFFGPLARCRYTPTCSEYALEAIRSQGAIRGMGLTLLRLCRCHPWGGCGYDPVPVPKADVRRTKGRECRHHQRKAPAAGEPTHYFAEAKG